MLLARSSRNGSTISQYQEFLSLAEYFYAGNKKRGREGIIAARWQFRKLNVS